MTIQRPTKLPQIPVLSGDNIKQVVQAIKETLEVGERSRGSEIDGYVKFRDLVELNLAKEDVAGVGGGSAGRPPVLAIPALPDGYNPEGDFTTPPRPTNLRASGGFTNVVLEWDGATFRNYAFTEVWRNEVDLLGEAVRIGTSIGNVYADPAVEGKTYYYWIRFVSAANVVGPFNLTSGTVAMTAIRAERLLELLNGKITREALYSDLGNRIDLIDAPATFPGSVSGRIQDVVEQVSAQVGDVTAAIEQRFQIAQSLNDGLKSQYTIKIDQNGYVSGFGLAVTSPREGPTTSSFAVRADEFFIASPAGPGIAPSMPFIVRTTPITINGVVVPVGVYMTDAFIQNGTITNAKIANAAIDDAKVANLSAAKLTVGDGTIGGNLKSANYVPGSSGWIVRPDGFAEFGSTAIRGQLTAAQIDTRGLLIRDSAGTVIFGSGTPLTSQYAAFAASSNIIENGHYKDSLVGTTQGFTDIVDPVISGRNLLIDGVGTYAVNGEGTYYTGTLATPPVGRILDTYVRNGTRNIAVTPGQRYEAYCWIGTIRCNGRVFIQWLDATGAIVGAVTGPPVEYQIAGPIRSIADMRQSLVFGVAPPSAVQAYVVVRLTSVGGAVPVLFVSRVYFGQAGVAQTEPSAWSPGSGLTQITPGNASTYIQNAAIDTLQVKDAAIVTAKIGDLAVTNAKIADLTVTSAKIQDLAVTNGKIDNLSVTTLKIGDNAVSVPLFQSGNPGVVQSFGNSQTYTIGTVGLLSDAAVLVSITWNTANFSAANGADAFAFLEVNGTEVYTNGSTAVRLANTVHVAQVRLNLAAGTYTFRVRFLNNGVGGAATVDYTLGEWGATILSVMK